MVVNSGTRFSFTPGAHHMGSRPQRQQTYSHGSSPDTLGANAVLPQPIVHSLNSPVGPPAGRWLAQAPAIG